MLRIGPICYGGRTVDKASIVIDRSYTIIGDTLSGNDQAMSAYFFQVKEGAGIILKLNDNFFL